MMITACPWSTYPGQPGNETSIQTQCLEIKYCFLLYFCVFSFIQVSLDFLKGAPKENKWLDFAVAHEQLQKKKNVLRNCLNKSKNKTRKWSRYENYSIISSPSLRFCALQSGCILTHNMVFFKGGGFDFAQMFTCYHDIVLSGLFFSLNREEKKRLRTPRRSLLQIPTQQLFTIKWLCLQNGEGTFGSDNERDDSRIEIRCQDVGRLLSGVWQPKVRLWGCRDQSFEN